MSQGLKRHDDAELLRLKEEIFRLHRDGPWTGDDDANDTLSDEIADLALKASKIRPVSVTGFAAKLLIADNYEAVAHLREILREQPRLVWVRMMLALIGDARALGTVSPQSTGSRRGDGMSTLSARKRARIERALDRLEDVRGVLIRALDSADANADLEPSLGALEALDQTAWGNHGDGSAASRLVDGEAEYDGRELEAHHAPPVWQPGWPELTVAPMTGGREIVLFPGSPPA